jgi:lysozyme
VAKRKNKYPILYKLVLLLLLIAISVTVGIYYYYKPIFVRYPAFGIDLPITYTIHGIDVSRYQGAIDWEEVKSMEIKNVKIGFSFIKATEGVNDEDKRFGRNWKEAKKAGMARGAYHFFNPYRSGKEQAQNFIETVVLSAGDLPPVLDVEQVGSVSKLQLQQRIEDWLQIVEMHYKVKPIIYTGADFYTNNLAGRFDAYPLWVAHYLVKDKPRVNREWSFWQHNETGRVNGIITKVDFNVFNGDSTAFKKLLLQ